MYRLLLASLIVAITSCSTPNAIKPIATADVGTGATRTGTSNTAIVTVPVTDERTPSGEATAVTTLTSPTTIARNAPQITVVTEFLTAYHDDPSGDRSAQYLSPELIKIYDSGKTIPAIIGIDNTYTTITIVGNQLFNDNQRAQITAKLDYASGSQTVDISLTRSNDTWQIAAVSAQPQK